MNRNILEEVIVWHYLYFMNHLMEKDGVIRGIQENR